jgi:hypothetical protein
VADVGTIVIASDCEGVLGCGEAGLTKIGFHGGCCHYYGGPRAPRSGLAAGVRVDCGVKWTLGDSGVLDGDFKWAEPGDVRESANADGAAFNEFGRVSAGVGKAVVASCVNLSSAVRPSNDDDRRSDADDGI